VGLLSLVPMKSMGPHTAQTLCFSIHLPHTGVWTRSDMREWLETLLGTSLQWTASLFMHLEVALTEELPWESSPCQHCAPPPPTTGRLGVGKEH
jgi:hypothetical protein